MTDINEIINNIVNLNINNPSYHWNRPMFVNDTDDINTIGNYMYNLFNDRWTFCSDYSGVHLIFLNIPNIPNNRCIYNNNIYNNHHHPDVHDDDCIICYSPIEFNRIILPCNHIFHQNCIEIWFQTCRASFNPLTCPTCRRNL